MLQLLNRKKNACKTPALEVALVAPFDTAVSRKTRPIINNNHSRGT